MKKIVYFKTRSIKRFKFTPFALNTLLFCLGVFIGCIVFRKYSFVVDAKYLTFQIILYKNLKLFSIVFLLSFSALSIFLLPCLILLLGFSAGCFLCESIVNGSFSSMLKVAICYLPHLVITLPIVSFIFKEKKPLGKEKGKIIVKTGMFLLFACVLVSLAEYLLKSLFM